jgi:hypothetical protein
MREHRGEADHSGGAVDLRCLDGRDLVLAQRFAHDVKAAG